MKIQLGSELTKITSTRLWWFLLLAMVALTTGFGTFLVYAALHAPASPLRLDSPGKIVLLYNLPVAIAYVFPLAFGVVLVTQEYNSRTIVHTLLGEPRKHLVYGAKLLTGLGVAFVYGVVSVGLSAAVTAVMLSAQGADPHLADSQVISALLGSLAVLTLWGPIGVAIGALVRNQVVAIVGILLVTRFIEPMVRMGAARVGYAQLGAYLPGGAGDTASGGTVIDAAAGMSPPSPLLGFLVLGAYTVILAALGQIRFTRYEAS
ncbi:ABC transporter permease [Streptomyces avidinii]|uniref:Neutral ceramidase superfamily lipid hydrolase n=1 Tax=Streptomyces avidinii TaxID=1895 RepID=A0ABS4L906_STRAV|nr:ABC transporter permease [Streptomyces avidinii]MBP2038577.1 putative neutral ceramidase superfamily lipid hydrolase [Streptomyces avidinii]GGZ23745.1 ABC transporter permease [Streptomyces avidinii]